MHSGHFARQVWRFEHVNVMCSCKSEVYVALSCWWLCCGGVLLCWWCCGGVFVVLVFLCWCFVLAALVFFSDGDFALVILWRCSLYIFLPIGIYVFGNFRPSFVRVLLAIRISAIHCSYNHQNPYQAWLPIILNHSQVTTTNHEPSEPTAQPLPAFQH